MPTYSNNRTEITLPNGMRISINSKTQVVTPMVALVMERIQHIKLNPMTGDAD